MNYIKLLLTLIFQAPWISFRNRSKSVRIGLMSVCTKVEFGNFVTINSLVRLRNVDIGDATYVGNGARIVNARVGRFCSIGPNCKIGLGAHPTDTFVSTHPAFYSTRGQTQLTFVQSDSFREEKQIVIGSDVWIGESAIVMDGATVGNGAVIGAGTIVTKDIPAFAVAVGVPARVIRYRFDDADIAFLVEHPWWERNLDWIRQHAASFQSIASYRAISW